ncbi:hypothetical protein [Mesorhizobium sp.]|uniref:hypothetical protein n=1 Tax=Mesorhizobium sp. TaxID=1871066 RepID=UPI000FE9D5CC|nr:hypothetical protein [Mesorhizobium sp.]RWE03849.1 MAG: hypothetical protein EOS40_01660 [Mesorhizobium sp.]
MTFPNPDLAPFEGENDKWCEHAWHEFSRKVTSPMLSAYDWDKGHAAYAHFVGFVFLAMADSGKRGDGTHQIMPDLLAKIRPMLETLIAGTGIVSFHEAKPLLTVLPGGKSKKEMTNGTP